MILLLRASVKKRFHVHSEELDAGPILVASPLIRRLSPPVIWHLGQSTDRLNQSIFLNLIPLCRHRALGHRCLENDLPIRFLVLRKRVGGGQTYGCSKTVFSENTGLGGFIIFSMTEVTLISLFTRTRFLFVPLARELLLFFSRQRLLSPGLGTSLGLCLGARLSPALGFVLGVAVMVVSPDPLEASEAFFSARAFLTRSLS